MRKVVGLDCCCQCYIISTWCAVEIWAKRTIFVTLRYVRSWFPARGRIQILSAQGSAGEVRKYQLLGENVSVLEVNEPKCFVILYTSQVVHETGAYSPGWRRALWEWIVLCRNTVHYVPRQGSSPESRVLNMRLPHLSLTLYQGPIQLKLLGIKIINVLRSFNLKLTQLEQRFFLIVEGIKLPLPTTRRWVSFFAVASLMF